MFQQLKNIDTAFKHVRLFSAVLIVCCVALTCYAIYISLNKVSEAQGRIYIISNGKAIEAFASNRKDNLPVEARDHVRSFHELFFSLSPENEAIETTIKKALYLADESAKNQYDDLKEKGFYSSVISGNVSQDVTCDSVTVDMNQYPYPFRYYGKQQIIRPSAIILRSLVTEGYLRNVARTDNNSHGFLIEKWVTVDNRDISVTKR